jgi:hypothetical protein
MTITDIRLVGDQFEFTAEADDSSKGLKMVFAGRVTGNEMQGTVEVRQSDGRNSRKSWKAKRDPLSLKPLDVER